VAKVELSASILSANFCHLADSVRSVLDAGVERIHFDVMDQHFVPNLTMGLMFCKALRQEGFAVPIDVHLMTYQVESLIKAAAKAGATSILVHPHACEDVARAVALIRNLGCEAGVALNPEVDLQSVMDLGGELDHVLVMGVNPGFSGQKWMPESLDKVAKVVALAKERGWHFRTGIDGGVNEHNAQALREAGASILVSGSTLFAAEDQAKVVAAMLG
jgi:ribulose-phosphate 3-epimerase